MEFICPNASIVWDVKGFTPCFENMILGFGSNMVIILAVLILAGAQRNRERYNDMRVDHKKLLVLQIVSCCGAFLALIELSLLMKNTIEGNLTGSHYWFYQISLLFYWIVILLVSRLEHWFYVLCNNILCFCWIIKPLMQIPHFLRSLLSRKVIICISEGSLFSAELMFGLIVIVIRFTCLTEKKREVNSVKDSLLSFQTEIKEGQTEYLDGKSGSFCQLFMFKFVNTMMDVGVRKQLDFEDLVPLPSELMPSLCHTLMLDCWVAEKNKHGSHLLFKAMYNAYGWHYLRLGLLKALNDGVGFITPLLLNKLIRYLQQGSNSTEGYILALSMGLTSIFKSFLDTQYSFRLMKLKLMLRSSIMTIIYHKCLNISLAERSTFSDGEIQTFMSVDADRTVNLCNSIHDAWSLPLQIGVALYLLYTQVSFAFISGVTITVLLIPVNKWISKLIASATEDMMKQKDERIRSSGELLTYIRTIKMYSWESLFSQRLMKKRDAEVKHLSTRKYMDAWCVFFWATTPTLFSLFTFGVFALMGYSLDAATVFTCVALFNTLISPLNSFPWVINGLIDAFISTGRLSKFLSCTEKSCNIIMESMWQIQGQVPPSSALRRLTNSNMPTAVAFLDACSIWSNNSYVEQMAALNNVSVEVPKGLLVAVVGEVGSGKSSLLHSILGEMRLIQGLIISQGSIAYVPQVPWIQSGSVRDNILFGDNFDTKRYREILHACALDVDISLMIGNDLSYIGEKGINLSGGQRSRLAFARAVYSDSDIYLLDDILSAVDSQVASWILHRVILGPLMNQKTRILCTHNFAAISAADIIVIMDGGQLRWVGTSTDFLESPLSKSSLPKHSSLSSLEFVQNESMGSTSNEIVFVHPVDNELIADLEKANSNDDIELRKEGNVDLSVYKSYARFASWPIVILICISAIFMQASRNGNDLWLSHWVDANNGTEQTRFYLIILSIFGVMNSIFTLARAFSFSYGGLRAAVQVHAELLSKLINAPVCYFDQNPNGRILNRLSSDLYAIDDSLPFIFNILLANFFSLLGIVAVLSYSQVMFLILLIPLGFVYKKLQFYYRCTSRELRRLDSVSRSPIYSSFTETLDGSCTIRAFKKEEIFMARFLDLVQLYQQTSYSEQTASLWLSLRLQLLSASVILFIGVMAVIGHGHDFSLTLDTPGLVGLALSYAAPIVSLLSSFLTSFTETEKEMVSVERVVEYMDIPQEELQGSKSLPTGWPPQGLIEFDHVSLQYRPSLPAALKDLSFSIEAGMKVGIVGRTGAGKSSILNALFRLTPICRGRILVDGTNIAVLAPRELRDRFSVVPQSPFLFEGFLRENLDPFGMTSDAKIWEALEKCHMKEVIETAGGLGIHVKENGTSFSVGQRQLICLARAIIKSSKILCLDECTASVDTQTALILQNAISIDCQDTTVLTIAHRISTVLEMDCILVLDHGILVEHGNPRDLLEDECSRFSKFAKASSM
ncbi:ABC transporter C family member 13-like isoform X1 [Zingiber officinale]|uniref:ABC transporter C family member 13-like isoform X1 n=2 Tax=Zingiber officinale TaxID=94328 RepID=UPI001C4D86B0|nr:ABC transporter C family member 13-like isoform X1 [Zingiber officinale]